jgi:phosphate transport system permease protein
MKSKPRDTRPGDRRFAWFVRILALMVLMVLGGIVYELFEISKPVLKHHGFSFLWNSDWNPVTESYGALVFIFGTVVSSILALLIATPISVGVALYLTEIAPKKIASALGFLVEMLAAIPSVVYGLWGIFVLAPMLRSSVQPFLGEHLGFLPFFQGPSF